jgi:hypothetical protein
VSEIMDLYVYLEAQSCSRLIVTDESNLNASCFSLQIYMVHAVF